MFFSLAGIFLETASRVQQLKCRQSGVHRSWVDLVLIG
ncbi:hypothetical protein SynA1825c_01312 [Synechococcus sp. A18-25c]|nr:hypothetical protein SynA1825c_01312 [Synechococcus sp. A18-25c]